VAAEEKSLVRTAPAGTREGSYTIGSGQRRRQMGNTPDDVGYQIQESEEEYDALLPYGPLMPLHEFWDAVTGRIDRSTGLDFGLNYTAVYQRASEANGPRDASGGDLDFFGQWHLAGCEDHWPGYLVFDTETRHR
jgi:hypothetical protein